MNDVNEIINHAVDMEDIRDVLQRRCRKPKIYLDHINPFEKYDEREFKRIYRFKKDTIKLLIEEIKPLLENSNKGRPVSPEIQVLSTIRYLAKGNYQSEAAHLHNFSQATMSRIVSKVSRAIASLIDRYIYFPINNRELAQVKEDFYEVANMPNIVGAIDCTHIKIKNPGHYPLLFMNRKGFFSLNVQVVCDADARIRNIVARWRGSAHDSRIWNSCSLKTRFETNEINGILIGDNGYPSSPFMLVPVLRPASLAENRYNEAHIKTRNVIERLFGQWKNKFRCFFHGMQMSLNTAKACIIALAVLHNISVNDRLHTEEDNTSDTDDNSDDEEDGEVMNGAGGVGGDNWFRQTYIDMYFN